MKTEFSYTQQLFIVCSPSSRDGDLWDFIYLLRHVNVGIVLVVQLFFFKQSYFWDFLCKTRCHIKKISQKKHLVSVSWNHFIPHFWCPVHLCYSSYSDYVFIGSGKHISTLSLPFTYLWISRMMSIYYQKRWF